MGRVMFQGSFEQKFSWPVTSGFFSEGIAHKVQTIKRKTFITKFFKKNLKQGLCLLLKILVSKNLILSALLW